MPAVEAVDREATERQFVALREEIHEDDRLSYEQAVELLALSVNRTVAATVGGDHGGPDNVLTTRGGFIAEVAYTKEDETAAYVAGDDFVIPIEADCLFCWSRGYLTIHHREGLRVELKFDTEVHPTQAVVS